jgi:hypothetical protein
MVLQRPETRVRGTTVRADVTWGWQTGTALTWKRCWRTKGWGMADRPTSGLHLTHSDHEAARADRVDRLSRGTIVSDRLRRDDRQPAGQSMRGEADDSSP